MQRPWETDKEKGMGLAEREGGGVDAAAATEGGRQWQDTPSIDQQQQQQV